MWWKKKELNVASVAPKPPKSLRIEVHDWNGRCEVVHAAKVAKDDNGAVWFRDGAENTVAIFASDGWAKVLCREKPETKSPDAVAENIIHAEVGEKP